VSARRPALRLIRGGGAAAGEAAPLGPALEFSALGIGLTLVVSLLARMPSWFRGLGAFQSLFLVGFAFFALAVVLRRRYERLPHVGLAMFAVAFATRALLAPLPPSLSGDLYRYVWEGRVLLAGEDPYTRAPDDARLEALRDRVIWPQVNHPELATIYPPLAEAGFALVARLSPTVTAFKLWVALHDLALVAVLMAWTRRLGAGPLAALVYAWNPLVLIEYAGTGHNDPTAMLWLALAFLLAESRPAWSAAALALGCLVKLAPLAALPFLLRRWPWRARAIALLALAAGLGVFWMKTRAAYSGLAAYWGAWRNNELAFHYLDRWLGGYAPARTAALALVAAAAAWAWWKRRDAARATRLVVRSGAVLSPVLHPWYLGWALMFEPLGASLPWLAFSATAVLNYGVFSTPVEGRSFHLPLAWRWIEYGVPLALAAALAIRARRTGPARDRRAA
jgi:hypothetical protein